MLVNSFIALADESHHGSVMTERGYTASKEQLKARLARIEGQVRGVSRMVDEDRYCIDVLTQISAIRAARDAVDNKVLDTLREVAKEIPAKKAQLGLSATDGED